MQDTQSPKSILDTSPYFSDAAIYFGDISKLSVKDLVAGLSKWAPAINKLHFNKGSGVIDYLNSPKGKNDKNLIKNHLGGKAWSLLQMSFYADDIAKKTTHKLAVPAGFTLFTDHCQDYKEEQTTNNLWPEIQRNIRMLERDSNKKFDGETPLLVSVRSGAAISLPGAMETVLNIGLTRKTLPNFAKEVGESVAWDSYCRLLEGYGNSVFGIPLDEFHKVAHTSDNHDIVSLQQKASLLEKLITDKGFKLPETPQEQLKGAIDCVFKSWNSANAHDLLLLEGKNKNNYLGTAVTIQQQVFGNKKDSFTGVIFSRDKLTGENKVTGSIIEAAQGSDIVSGAKKARNINTSKKVQDKFSDEMATIRIIANYLKKKNNGIERDIEITYEKDNGFFLLQDRDAKMSGLAELKSAMDFYTDNRFTLGEKQAKDIAISRVNPDKLSQLFLPVIASSEVKSPDFKKRYPEISDGVKASLGCVQGIAVFSISEVKRLKAEALKIGQPIPKMILIVDHPYQETVAVAKDVEGLLTLEGSPASHALLYYGNCGTPFCTNLKSGIKDQVKSGDKITLNSNAGTVLQGWPEIEKPDATREFKVFLNWCQEVLQNNDFEVWSTTGDNNSVLEAQRNGASGVGVYKVEDIISKIRSDHKYMVPIIEDMASYGLLANSSIYSEKFDKPINNSLALFEEKLKSYLVDLYKTSGKFPVGIRLFDPVISELLPDISSKKFKNICIRNEFTEEEQRVLENKIQLKNPSLGIRGSRNIIAFRQFYESNIRAVFAAAKETGACPRIVVPFVSQINELMLIRAVAEQIAKEENIEKYEFGMMLETSSAYMTHKTPEFVTLCDFFYTGPSDSTEKLLAISREDSIDYITKATASGVYSVNPLTKIHPDFQISLTRVMEVVKAIKSGEQEIQSEVGLMKIGADSSILNLEKKGQKMQRVLHDGFPNIQGMIQNLDTDKSDFKVMIGGRHATNGQSIDTLVKIGVYPSVSAATLHKNTLLAAQSIIANNMEIKERKSANKNSAKLWSDLIANDDEPELTGMNIRLC